MNRRSEPSLWKASLWILQKDLLVEWRSRARLNALFFFAIATLLIFSFAAGADNRLLQRNAGGYLWLAILFASVLALGESFRIEQENSSLEALRLIPTDPRAIFLGKAVGNALLLLLLSLVIMPIMAALYGVTIALGLGRLLAVLALGCSAISAPGTIYGAIASNARARDVLLPLLLFPVLIPALLSAVMATTLIFQEDPMDQFGSSIKFLGAFNLIYWGLGFVLFPKVIEE